MEEALIDDLPGPQMEDFPMSPLAGKALQELESWKGRLRKRKRKVLLEGDCTHSNAAKRSRGGDNLIVKNKKIRQKKSAAAAAAVRKRAARAARRARLRARAGRRRTGELLDFQLGLGAAAAAEGGARGDAAAAAAAALEPPCLACSPSKLKLGCQHARTSGASHRPCPAAWSLLAPPSAAVPTEGAAEEGAGSSGGGEDKENGGGTAVIEAPRIEKRPYIKSVSKGPTGTAGNTNEPQQQGVARSMALGDITNNPAQQQSPDASLPKCQGTSSVTTTPGRGSKPSGLARPTAGKLNFRPVMAVPAAAGANGPSSSSAAPPTAEGAAAAAAGRASSSSSSSSGLARPRGGARGGGLAAPRASARAGPRRAVAQAIF